MKYDIRQYRAGDDDEQIVTLLNLVNRFDDEEQAYTLESFREEMADPILDTPNSYFVAETSDGQIVGEVVAFLALSSTGEHTGRIFLNVHPDWRDPEVGVTESLIKRGESRLIQRRSELPEGGTYHANLQAEDKRTDLIELYEQLGYANERTYYTMLLSPVQGVNFAVPPLPDGISVRNYHIGADEEQYVNTRNEAWLDHHGGHIRSLESWQHHVQTKDFRADLTFVAQAENGQFAGVCWCEINPDQTEPDKPTEGWVQNLAVLRPWRKHGLGNALLMRGVNALAQAGVANVKLGVDGSSLTGAVRLYEKAGFRIHKSRLMYVKSLL